jgi:sensor histidine kinase YesM
VRTLRSILILDLTAGLAAWLLTINLYHSSRAQIAERLARSMASAFFIATPTAFTVIRFSGRMLRRPFPLNWILLSLSILSCVVAGSLAFSATAVFFGIQAPYWFWSSFWAHVQFSAVLALSLGIGMSGYYLLRRELNATNVELRNRQLEQERASKLAAEAQLASLESHVRPHFLFNTLNTISSLIPDDPKLAESLVGKLAALLRFTLDSNQARTAPLERELAIVSDYLEIERARHGDRLRFRIEVPADLRSAVVPALSIQTLVENSVKHAVGSRFEGAEIRIGASERAGSLVVEVSDDGPGFTAEAIRPGHGLDNLQRRLTALYGPASRLEIANVDGMVTVSFRLPRGAAT